MGNNADKSTALWVIRRLRRAGYQALLAGGCVRDMLLGRRPQDYDVATDAAPQQVRGLFRHVLMIGAKFGVAMVVRRQRTVEVATFRSDATYSDGRHPDAVRFSSPREDALRRDFTINGMFYDPLAGEVVDYVRGRQDLARGVIRTIGEADRRFAEDYLRMLRAVRFAERLGFDIDPGTVSAVRRHAPKIASISGERVYDELTKMLGAASAGGALRRLAELNLAEQILPGLFAAEPLWPSAVLRAEALAGRKDAVLTLAALLAELPAKSVGKLTRRWGASNEVRDTVRWLGDHRGGWARADAEMPLCELKRLLAHADWPRLKALWRAEEKIQTGKQTRSRRLGRRVGALDPARIAPAPLVTGDDLIAWGLTEGPRLGKIRRAVYDAQLNEQVLTRRAATALARELIAAPPV